MKPFVLLVFSLGLVVAARAEVTRMIPLNYADARMIAAYLGGAVSGQVTPDQAAEQLARASLAGALHRLPAADGTWIPYMQAQSYPSQADGPTLPIPEGLTQPPVAIVPQNALLVRGSIDAIDQLQETIRLLDRPVAMINVELKLIDAPAQQVDQWGLDLQAMAGSAGGSVTGNAPPGGSQLRWGTANLSALLGRDPTLSRGNNTTAVNVTTLNDTPASVGFGETLPFFVNHIAYDAYGHRHVDSQVYAIFTGVQLWVHPRITGGHTVTMRLIPAIVTGAGSVTAPDGSSMPITRNIMAETQVRVADGQSIVIGGMRRLSDSQTASFRSLLGNRKIANYSNPLLIVTPHIIQPQMTNAGMVR